MMDISVVIPTYNRGEKILRSINSVLQQKCDGHSFNIKEIIIIDDHGNDDTEKVVNSIGDDRIKYYYLDVNVGAAGARNEGVKRASCDWIAFHDSDDIWNFDKLEKQTDYAQKGAYDLVYCGMTTEMPNGEKEQLVPQYEGNIYEKLLLRNYIGAPTILVKRDSFMDCGGFDDSMRSLEDWDFAIRFAKDHMIGCVKESLIDVKLSTTGVSSDLKNYFVNYCKIIGKNREELVKRDLFNKVTEPLLQKAQKFELLPEVAKILECYLK